MTPHELIRAEMAKKTAVLICGTGPSLEVLRDQRLVDAIPATMAVFCVQTSHHFFRKIDALLLGRRYARQISRESLRGKTVRFLIAADNLAGIEATLVPVTVCADAFRRQVVGVPVLCTDLAKPLSHGPTTILDAAIPAAMHCGFRHIYLLGAEYSRSSITRFAEDAKYRPPPGNGFKGEYDLAAKRWLLWSEYFLRRDIALINLSPGSTLDFPKADIYTVLGIARSRP